MFTDASVKAKGDALDQYFYPRRRGTLGASIVLQPDKIKGLSLNTMIIRIVQLELLARPTVYMLETLAAVMAAIIRQLAIDMES